MTKKQETLTTAQTMDEEGFLLQQGTWTKEVAHILAQDEMTEDLTEEHWRLIDCVRQYYLEFETVPPVRMLVRRTGLSLRRIYELFPNGYSKGVCKIAGIPGHILKATCALNVDG